MPSPNGGYGGNCIFFSAIPAPPRRIPAPFRAVLRRFAPFCMIGSEASMLRFSYLWIAISAVSAAPRSDWLLHPPTAHAAVEPSADGREVSLANGLIRRAWRLKPDCATAAFENLTNGASMIRGVKPEAILTLDGVETPVGGLLGQPDYAYLLPQWLDSMSADPRALHCTGWERAPVEPRFGWK